MGDVLHHNARTRAAEQHYVAAAESLGAPIASAYHFIGAGRVAQPVAGHVATAVWLAPHFSLARRWAVGVMPPSSARDAARMRELILRVAHDEIKIWPALHQGKLEPQARKLLKRLANKYLPDSKAAIEALARLENWCERKGRGSCWPNILIACINVEKQARTFPENIKEAKETLVRVKQRCIQLRKALAELRKLLCENRNQNWAVLWGNGAAIEHGPDLLDYGIDTEKRVAEEAFAQFGATRKKEIESAPRNAAIWPLAEAVKLYTGKPHYREVASRLLGATDQRRGCRRRRMARQGPV
jgi:hypothetical protein